MCVLVKGWEVVAVMVFGCKKNVVGEVSGAEKNREIWPCTVYWIDRNERDAGSSITQNGVLHSPRFLYIYMYMYRARRGVKNIKLVEI